MPVTVPVAPLPTGPGPDGSHIDGEDQEDAGEGQEHEDPVRVPRSFALPNLRPYYDVRPLKELGPLAVAVGRVGGPPLLRGLTKAGHGAIIGVLCLLRGGRLLLGLFCAWLTGSIGKGGSFPARLGIAVAAGYVLATAPAQHPAAPYGMAAAFVMLLIAAGTGRIPEPGAKKQRSKAGEKGRKNEKTAGEKPKEGAAPEATAKGEEVEKEKLEGVPRGRLLGRLRQFGKGREETPAAGLAKDSESSPDEPAGGIPEESPETLDQTPAEPSRGDLILALHHHVGESSGVLLTTLRIYCSLPNTRAVRRVLGEAGIRVREGVRAVPGSGPGVHREDFPPLPPRQALPQGSGVVAGESANANANNAANSPEEEIGAPGNDWTPEDIERGYRFVKDAERGPSAWKVEHHER
ncbi:hypothetical protein [Streptomyces sp. NBC_00120]|uniref:hypothetical protein n=1 Tax=Streptomyces sp. NBC_00120 TaxID=2975660 RepID=UPI0022509378|nr:hypothetical protein [Streptomyces sp. NBC_00120]MCX5326330.1 hypothetical protein [Streptomyces sp. NBC_00120]